MHCLHDRMWKVSNERAETVRVLSQRGERVGLYLDILLPSSARLNSKRLKATQLPSGLIPNWDSKKASRGGKKSSTAGSSTYTRSTTTSRANTGEPEEDTSAFGYGGIPSDDDNIMRQELSHMSSGKLSSKY